MMVVALPASVPRYCGTVSVGEIGSAVSKNVRMVIGVACLPTWISLRRRLVDLLVQRIVEVLRIEERRDAVHRLVVDEDGAEQRLLGLQIVRSLTEGELALGRADGGEPIGNLQSVLCHG